MSSCTMFTTIQPPAVMPVPMTRTLVVQLFGKERDAYAEVVMRYPDWNFIAPARGVLSALMEEVWMALAKMKNPNERVEVAHEDYLVSLRIMEMSANSSHLARPGMSYCIKVELQYLTCPRPPRPKLPAPKPWTTVRIAAATKEPRMHPRYDPMRWYLVESRFNELHTTPFPTLKQAVAQGVHAFEYGNACALCVVRNGSLHYWHWARLDDTGRDAAIQRAIEAATECGLVVTKVVRRITS